MSDKPMLPDEILIAIPIAILKLTSTTAGSSYLPQKGLQSAMELWIESSWKKAENLGLTAADYVEWMYLGHWNLAGSAEDLNIVSSYTSLAGAESWALKKANISIDAAIQMSMEEGLETVIDNAKIMMGLSSLFPDTKESEAEKPHSKQPESKDYKIDFPK
jgi:hypothetical protein